MSSNDAAQRGGHTSNTQEEVSDQRVAFADTSVANEANESEPAAGSEASLCANGGQSLGKHLDDECERLLRNAKKQVKQMMEEAVTKKFIHEASSSIISLCVAIDACLSHRLKRRTLGLFKTNSSTALVQKIAKYCAAAQDVLRLVEEQEKRLNEEEQHQLQCTKRQYEQLAASRQFEEVRTLRANGIAASTSVNSLLRQQQQKANKKASPINNTNKNLHRRHLWLKCALIEKKLVNIVEFLASNATKYYENGSLMADFLSAQLLCSLLVGPCALEYSCSKVNDFYQYEEPSADELLKRHKLSNPIACLCSYSTHQSGSTASSSECSLSSNQQQQQRSCSVRRSSSSVAQQLGRSLSSATAITVGQKSPLTAASEQEDGDQPAAADERNWRPSKQEVRRRPLGLKTSLAISGALVTDCHHCSCKDIGEHQHTRGYSFKCKTSSSLPATVPEATAATGGQLQAAALRAPLCANGPLAVAKSAQQQQQTGGYLSLWSPRLLHETLHQNSRSSLLYAKNNVLLETQSHGLLAGYLSLHETSCDLIIKWIPNQLINGTTSNKQTETSEDLKQGPEQRSKSLDDQVARNSGLQHQQQASGKQTAVGSSYLDLVVFLSVSRVVLLHCHFAARTKPPSGISSGNATLTRNDKQECCADSGGNAPTAPSDQTKGLATVETLILVEADGVQHAPFKFPKGGLRWFLSCLESGLHPERYLELAIKPDGSNDWPWAEDEAQGAPETELACEQGQCSAEPRDGFCAPETPSADASGRLDTLLRRLPSLKREQPLTLAKKKNKASLSAGDAAHCAHTCSSPAASGALLNYVYRIVSLRQSDWASLPTPHSALSEASSVGSAGSASLQGAGGRWASRVFGGSEQSSEGSVGGGQQRFCWSMSRLARFSTRYSSGSSSSSLAASQTASMVARPVGAAAAADDEQANSRGFESTGLSVSGAEDLAVVPGNHMRPAGEIKRDSSSELLRIEAKLDSLKNAPTVQGGGDELISAQRDHSLQTLCESMRKQILARAFYGWLAYYRRTKIIRTHLVKLLNCRDGGQSSRQQAAARNHLLDSALEPELFELMRNGLTEAKWRQLMDTVEGQQEQASVAVHVCQLVYYGGVESDTLRAQVWPYLLGHYEFGDSAQAKSLKDLQARQAYESSAREWAKLEKVIRQRDKEILAANMARVERRKRQARQQQLKLAGRTSRRISEFALVTVCQTKSATGSVESESESSMPLKRRQRSNSSIGCWQDNEESNELAKEDCSETLSLDELAGGNETGSAREQPEESKKGFQKQQKREHNRRRYRLESMGSVGSDASITDQFGNNLHRIDKDVQRCDRQFWYFKKAQNLEKLRNIMCSYVWQHLDVGYVQGMCDLAAPILVIFDDEFQAFCCYDQLMKRMVANFPQDNAMDRHFESLKYLMQVLDPKLFEILQRNGDYNHFYFCYRWLLLDFKRELEYKDVFLVWETIWAARRVVSEHFVVFLALAMVRYYRDIIIENNMDFTDTIKFFNEMAERHDAKKIIELAQDCIVELDSLIGN